MTSGVALLLVMALLLRMLFRNFSSSSLAIELTSLFSLVVPHCVLILAVLGTSLGLSSGKYIHIELLSLFAPEGSDSKFHITKKYLQKLVGLGSLLAIGVFIWYLIEAAVILSELLLFLVYLPVFLLIGLKFLINFSESASK